MRRALVVILLVAGLSPRASAGEAWREAFLVLATGNAAYRPLHDAALAVFRAEGESAVLRAALEHDPLSPREGPALARVAEHLGSSAVPPLLSALDACDSDARRASILHALSWTRASSTAPRLAPWLAWPDVRVRAAACAALGDLADSGAIPALAVFLGDTEPAVRRIAADALARMVLRSGGAPGGAALDASLVRTVADTDAWTRRNAGRASTAARGAP